MWFRFEMSHLGRHPIPILGQPRIVDAQAGLPSAEVQAADVVGDKLFLSLGGGYLVEYDLKTRSVVTLASAQRKLAESPLLKLCCRLSTA